jgi:hypothetical protein
MNGHDIEEKCYDVADDPAGKLLTHPFDLHFRTWTASSSRRSYTSWPGGSATKANTQTLPKRKHKRRGSYLGNFLFI